MSLRHHQNRLRRALNRSLDPVRGFSARRFHRMGWGDGRGPSLDREYRR